MVILQIGECKRVIGTLLFLADCLSQSLHVPEIGVKYFGNTGEGTFVAWREIRETFMKEVTFNDASLKNHRKEYAM